MRPSIWLSRLARQPSHFSLPSGRLIPSVGLGTWKSGEETEFAVFTALEAGYRHIDTAWAYNNEVKLWNSYHGTHVVQGVHESLEALKMDYLDLYLIHWPVAFRHVRAPSVQKTPRDREGNVLVDNHLSTHFMQTYRQLESLVREGLVRDIGVSNFNMTKLDVLLGEARIRPAVNQVELHLGCWQPALRRFCRENDLILEAYSPLGSAGAPCTHNPVVQQLARKHACDPGQVLVSWNVARGIVALPKSTSPEHIRSNLRLIDLSEEDVRLLETEAGRIPQQRTVDKSAEWDVEDIFAER